MSTLKFGFFLALYILTAGCSGGEEEMPAEMSPAERQSFAAIKGFNKCMEPHVDAAKNRSNLSEAQIENFGTKCPKELETAAQLMAKRPLSSFHGAISQDEWNPDFEKRLSYYRASFASSFRCELRPSLCPAR